MRALLLSDLHFGSEDREALAAAAAFCAAFAPDLVLVAGDISTTGRRREMEAAADWLRGLGRPTIATPGNHDAPYWQPFARLAAPFSRFDRLAKFAVATHERIAVRPLLTARGVQWRRLDWSLGVAAPDDVEAALAGFAALPPAVLRVVLAHHPLAGPEDADRRARTRGGEAAAARFAEGGVDLILSGHLHRPFVRETPAGSRTWSIGSGTLSRRTRDTPPAFTALRSLGPEALEVTHLACLEGAAAPASRALLPLRPGRLNAA